ncbi:MAG: serine/threonine-protein kinase RsbW [Solirubrobacteraceae bacterium]|jgi:anti-sigma regulatory factor (Ser/Thr protein kinase)|nr:serine/threonine-protein kinase RsbW [Solirubrobacteraceae bacterium]
MSGGAPTPADIDLEFELPRAACAAGEARHALRRLCADALDAEMLTDAELLLSEVVTNALRHGPGSIRVRAHLDQEQLFVEVIDQGSGFERELRRRDFDAVGGWGLGIVEDLASRWGVHEGTTHVWFELERPGPRLGESAAPDLD